MFHLQFTPWTTRIAIPATFKYNILLFCESKTFLNRATKSPLSKKEKNIPASTIKHIQANYKPMSVKPLSKIIIRHPTTNNPHLFYP